jgi:cytochrome c oxidase subunit III
MEQARRTSKAGAAGRWLAGTLLLGGMFLTGQVMVWFELSSRGIYVSTNPHSSFFYLLTGLHGLHILGGIVAVSWAALSRPEKLERLVRVAAIYWHFMGALWVYLLVLLFAWR